jgi:GR25 family glycosyltransferase involved in LPS biosynthesis
MDCVFMGVISMNKTRRERMQRRLRMIGVDCVFLEGVTPEKAAKYPEAVRSGCMLAHVQALQTFLKTSKDYAIVAEDDVYLHRDFKRFIPKLIRTIRDLSLDLLLLGYLIDHQPSSEAGFHQILDTNFGQFYTVPATLWGTQMYLVSRTHAMRLVREFDPCCYKGPVTYSADFLITKTGSVAFLYPMMAVEEGEIRLDDTSEGGRVHARYHRACKDANYKPDVYV